MIASQFFDRDVGTVDRIEILPDRTHSWSGRGWYLNKVCHIISCNRSRQEALVCGVTVYSNNIVILIIRATSPKAKCTINFALLMNFKC